MDNDDDTQTIIDLGNMLAILLAQSDVDTAQRDETSERSVQAPTLAGVFFISPQ